MADRLLTYYERELDFIRHLAVEFAETHPQAAEGLRLGPGQSADPHVERLIEAVALLSARVRLKLDDTFPEFSDAFLGTVYPHYLNPLPPSTIVRMDLDRQATGKAVVPRGAEIETRRTAGQPVRFTTCFETTLFPIEVTAADVTAGRYDAPPHPAATRAAAVLRLRLRCFDPKGQIGKLGLETLRLHFEGSGQLPGQLYEMLARCTLGVTVASRERDGGTLTLGADAVVPVGFEDREALLPVDPRVFHGYRILTEYLLAPRKFLFVDIAGLGAAAGLKGNEWDLFFYLSDVPAGDMALGPANIALGCVPVVNLFEYRCDPISLEAGRAEILIEPDKYNLDALEIYDLLEVTLVPPDGGEAVTAEPFYAVRPPGGGQAGFYWHAARRPAAEVRGGSDLYLSIVDFNGRQPSLDKWTLQIRARCLNRDMAARLPYGGGQPHLSLLNAAGPVTALSARAALDKTVRPEIGDARAWNLISQLSLGHLPMIGDAMGAGPLKELLDLHDFRRSNANRGLIEGIKSVSARRVARKIDFPEGVAVCQGLEVALVYEPPRDAGSSTFLFMTVLERFMSRSASINAFVELVVTLAGRDGEYYRWPARAGTGHLL